MAIAQVLGHFSECYRRLELTVTRPETSNQRFYVDQHLFVDLYYQVVLLDSKILNLTRMEYLLLVLLMQYGGEVVPRPILMIVTRAVDMHIRKLQKKLRARQYIERVVGIGYRFRPSLLPRA
jgi:DNA-binding response OmpR family regulator